MKYKTKMIDGIEVCYSSEWINDLENENHFKWYYQQAKLVYDHCNRNDQILEIGIGTGLLSDLLRKRKWKILTLDIDESKEPDICKSASDYDYSNIDVVLAFEIFEHIPFSTFEKIVKRLSKSKVKNILFSLPWNERILVDFKLRLPIVQDIGFTIPIRKKNINTKAHFWELAKKEKYINDKRLIKIKTIIDLFNKNGFDIILLKKIEYIQYFQVKYAL